MCASLPRHARHAVTSENFLEYPVVTRPGAAGTGVGRLDSLLSLARKPLTCRNIRSDAASCAMPGGRFGGNPQAAGAHYTLGF